MTNNILLAIKNHIYEVSSFVNKHPGEGINSVYLCEHNHREVSLLFNKFHQTEESEEHLINARAGKHDKIKYIAPYYFLKRIPKYYHYVDNITTIDEKSIPNKSYFLFQAENEHRDNTINIYVKKI